MLFFFHLKHEILVATRLGVSSLSPRANTCIKYNKYRNTQYSDFPLSAAKNSFRSLCPYTTGLMVIEYQMGCLPMRGQLGGSCRGNYNVQFAITGL